MSKFNEIVKNALGEAKQRGDLYHGTTFESLLKMLNKNTMYAVRPIGISVSRNSHIGNAFGDGTVIVFDGNKLSEKYKIFPMSFQGGDVGEEVIQTNKNIPLHYKTPEHNNAFLSLVYRLDNGSADENEFANMYDGSELPDVIKYIKEIRLPKEYFSQKFIKQLSDACEKNGYKLPPVTISKLAKDTADKKFFRRSYGPYSANDGSLRNLNSKDKADLEANFDYAGYDLPDEIN